MGTRGLIGIVHKGKELLAYNHSDSYPSQLGIRFIKTVRELGVDRITQYAENVKVVNDRDKPTDEDIELMMKLNVFEDLKDSLDLADPSRHSEWYEVLRNYQGDLKGIVEDNILWWLDYNGFQFGSSCEWVYVANLDKGCVEVFVRNRVKPNGKRLASRGRYSEAVKADPTLVENKFEEAILLETLSFEELKALPDVALTRWCQRMTRVH